MSGMAWDSHNSEPTPFAIAVYGFLRANIDNIDINSVSGADFSTLLDLKKAVDDVVAQGMEKWRSGGMS